MNQPTRKFIAIALLALGISLPPQASATCLAPEPTCAVVLLGALVTGIVHETEDPQDGQEQAAPRDAALEAVAAALEQPANGRLAGRIRDAARGPALDAIVNRFDKRQLEGPKGLRTMMDRQPRLFDDLDRIADLLGRHYPDRTMAERYGPPRLDGGGINWRRYANLARDAQAVHGEIAAEDG